MSQKKKTSGKTNRGSLAGVRIIGGALRGRSLFYSGDLLTRPMKDRLREAIFNLVGPAVKGMQAIDLFAGSGALGIEAVSRGAKTALLIERHFPTVKLIEQSIDTLGLQHQVRAVATDTFYWAGQQLEVDLPAPQAAPWLVFCSPPYDLYLQQGAELESMLQRIGELAPDDSIIVVESDDRYDHQQLPWPGSWDLRSYPPAMVAIWSKQQVEVE